MMNYAGKKNSNIFDTYKYIKEVFKLGPVNAAISKKKTETESLSKPLNLMNL